MVCYCCNEEDDDLLKPFTSTTTTTGDYGSGVISPMNSHFTALTCADTLRSIMEKLPVADLARASCVCKIWRVIGSDKEMVKRAFGAPWKLKDVFGNPTSGSFWRDCSLSKFAISHRLVRGDSVASLAVKYSVQVMDIKRLNNMMSDHGIYSRDRLLIPVSNPDILLDGACYIEVDRHAKREVAVVYLDGGPDIEQLSSIFTRLASDHIL
ncbi:hypothetical protein Leryth_015330 [Lithospermum erythrorhizon]|nr:hypothetical protein Leryth_015330 [Lithospermum erythrorhizon]